MKLRLLLFLALLTACMTAVAGEPWARTYLEDLTAARDAIAADHPGYVDAQNPAFRNTMQSAWEEARRAKVTDYDSYRVALTRFVNRFHDAHLSAGFKKPFESLRDAGIVVRRVGDTFVVDEADARYGASLKGATLISCDGQPARAHFEKRVLSWRGRPSVEADWYQLAPLLFVDFGPPSPPAPSRCRFSTGDVALKWEPSTPERVDALMKDDTHRELSIEQLEGGTIWVNLPTFSVNDEPSIAKMHALIAATNEAVKRGDWHLLVFDLRGNGGGSAVWGSELAEGLFGEAWTQAAWEWLSDGVYTEWRVSSDNVKAIEGHVAQMEQRHGADSEQAKNKRTFHKMMSDALARGDKLLGEPSQRKGIPKPDPVALPGRVVVLTTPSCFSACLDFLDLMRVHPAVVQAGEVTGVDTVYMESWGKGLPSGNARLNYPLKVYRNRRRGNNEPYAPKVRFEGDFENDAEVRAWVMEHFGPVRVLTYNIHAGKDTAGAGNLERVAALIRDQRADVVLLQEVDRNTTRSGNVDQLATLERLTNMHGAFGNAIDFQGGQYGIAILSRWPIAKSETVPLHIASQDIEPRVALFANVVTPNGTVTIANTHLDHHDDDTWRRQQVAQLLAAATARHPWLLGGDFNSTPDSAVQQTLREAKLGDSWAVCGRGAELTYPAIEPLKRIDYLFLTGTTRCAAASVIDSDASDHRPVVIDVSR